MNLPFSLEVADIHPDLIADKIREDYENLRPSDITRYILNIFEDKNLSVELVFHVISNLHDHFCIFEYDKISEASGYNIRNELQGAKELFKDKEQNIPISEAKL